MTHPFSSVVFLRGIDPQKKQELLLPFAFCVISGALAYFLVPVLFPGCGQHTESSIHGVLLFAGWVLVGANTFFYGEVLDEAALCSSPGSEGQADILPRLRRMRRFVRLLNFVVGLWALASLAACCSDAHSWSVVRESQEIVTIAVFGAFSALDLRVANLLRLIADDLENQAAIRGSSTEQLGEIAMECRANSKWCLSQVYAIDLPVAAGVAAAYAWGWLLFRDHVQRTTFFSGAVLMHIQLSQLVYLWLGSFQSRRP